MSERRSILWRLRRLGFVLLVLAVVGVGGVWMALNTIDLPPATPVSETTFVCDLEVPDGQCDFNNSMAHLSASEDRVAVDYEDLPPVLVQAVLAAEDRKFFDHSGVDPIGIGRAFYQSVLGDSASQQGGSTITQQYVKLTYLSSERSLTRKLKEAVLAVKLEGELDKRDVLTRYLNQIYFGRGAYGVEAASRAYFGVPVQGLQLHQAAYLAGLIRAPERADAIRDPDEATRRRDTVLAGMVAEGYITAGGGRGRRRGAVDLRGRSRRRHPPDHHRAAPPGRAHRPRRGGRRRVRQRVLDRAGASAAPGAVRHGSRDPGSAGVHDL